MFKEDIPSKRTDLLRKIVGQRITKLVRYSWDPPEAVVTNWGISREDVFGHTEGPLLVTTENGDVVGFGSREDKASITVWMEMTASGERKQRYSILDDPDLCPIDASDDKYSRKEFASIVGDQVILASIFRRAPENSNYATLPREAAIQFETENGQSIVLSHWLHKGRNSFGILLLYEITDSVQGELEEYLRLQCNT